MLLKADSGPGRKNTELLVYLRVRGFYFIPGLPNSTHVTQEMELLIGKLKFFLKNLEKLTRGRLIRGSSVPSGAEIVGYCFLVAIFSMMNIVLMSSTISMLFKWLGVRRR